MNLMFFYAMYKCNTNENDVIFIRMSARCFVPESVSWFRKDIIRLGRCGGHQRMMFNAGGGDER